MLLRFHDCMLLHSFYIIIMSLLTWFWLIGTNSLLHHYYNIVKSNYQWQLLSKLPSLENSPSSCDLYGIYSSFWFIRQKYEKYALILYIYIHMYICTEYISILATFVHTPYTCYIYTANILQWHIYTSDMFENVGIHVCHVVCTYLTHFYVIDIYMYTCSMNIWTGTAGTWPWLWFASLLNPDRLSNLDSGARAAALEFDPIYHENYDHWHLSQRLRVHLQSGRCIYMQKYAKYASMHTVHICCIFCAYFFCI
jgi:hypothetical protein